MKRRSSAIHGSVPRQGISFVVRGLWWRARSRLHTSIGRSRRTAPKRLMYVFDYGSSVLSESQTSVHFREAPDESMMAPVPETASGEERGCIVGSLNERIVYRAWYVRSEPQRLQGAPSNWSPCGRVLFLHGGTTEPAFRGRGIHSAATRWLLRHERAPGIEHAACFVHADNHAARRTMERVGFRLVGPVDE